MAARARREAEEEKEASTAPRRKATSELMGTLPSLASSSRSGRGETLGRTWQPWEWGCGEALWEAAEVS